MTGRVTLILVFLIITFNGFTQNVYRALIKDKTSNEALAGVIAKVKDSNLAASSDKDGMIILDGIPDSLHVVIISLVGYKDLIDSVSFPITEDRILLLEPEAEQMEEVIVEGTRSNKSIEDIPTRTEVLNEEIDEASTMDPSKVAHLLTHSTGIQVQQTSATSNMANVRIQGLDGRYTQILKDGFPNYGGFSGSLSIMQIPPLDLKQVEYIKGSSSTLYGAGAISGLINLISKDPSKEETLFHINASHIGAFDVNAFLSKKIDKVGFTLLAQRNTHRIFDADKDGYSDLPELTKYNINPKLFFYLNSRNKIIAGATFTSENRVGGDLRMIRNKASDSLHFYKESNEINRITTQLKYESKLTNNTILAIRNSFNFFRRGLSINPDYFSGEYRFAGNQVSSFSELSLTNKHRKNVLIGGLNFYTDDFKEEKLSSNVLRREEYRTAGAFLNYTFNLGEKVAIEAGLRGDYVVDKRPYILPRISTLFKWTKKLTTRIGGGMGYRNASIFNQEAELLGYKNVLSIDKSKTHAEQSFGGNADIGFKTPLGDRFFITINQMFFYTYLDRPLILSDTGSFSGVYHFINANGYTQSYGGETFFKFGFYDFVLFVGYTYTHATNIFNGKETALQLTPMHSLKGDLLYALPGKWRIGVDYEYKSGQILSNSYRTPEYWTFGAVVEYTLKNFTLFGNVENFTDIRQTKYESLRSAPYNTPQFTQVWAPLDGIVVNGGIKVRL
jgi:iron complex outermembrane receptor protein